MFTRDPDIYGYFQEQVRSVEADPGLFRQDEYFTRLFALLEQKKISYPEYRDALAGK